MRCHLLNHAHRHFYDSLESIFSPLAFQPRCMESSSKQSKELWVLHIYLLNTLIECIYSGTSLSMRTPL